MPSDLSEPFSFGLYTIQEAAYTFMKSTLSATTKGTAHERFTSYETMVPSKFEAIRRVLYFVRIQHTEP